MSLESSTQGTHWDGSIWLSHRINIFDSTQYMQRSHTMQGLNHADLPGTQWKTIAQSKQIAQACLGWWSQNVALGSVRGWISDPHLPHCKHYEGSGPMCSGKESESMKGEASMQES
jgi:hypothetical protein